MRKTIFAEGEYYHIYNRGVEKRKIFLDDNDRWRFMTLLLIFQGKFHADNIHRIVKNVQHLELNIEPLNKIISNKIIDLLCFCMMPNHYHLILKETKRGGISDFCQRLGDSYTKYFNTKHERTGHLFGGNFQSIHIDRNEYFIHLSSYIHNNPAELIEWRGIENQYTWSSLTDYTNQNRWDKFLDTEEILSQFKNRKNYLDYVLENKNKINNLDSYYID